MRAAISLLVLLLSMCGVQTESHSTDFSTQDLSTELKELRDLVMELRGSLRHTRDDVKVLEADNVAMKQKLAVSEADNVATKMEVDNLKKENAAQEAELTAVKTRLAATETGVENLEKEIRVAPKVAFSAGLKESGGYTRAEGNDLNLVFTTVITNVGEAYSSTTGFFTAPVRGVYYFRFTVMDNLDSRYMGIRMYKNGQQLMRLWEYDTDDKPSYLSSGLTLQLEKGDTVNMLLPHTYRLYEYVNYNQCTFSGFLLFPL